MVHIKRVELSHFKSFGGTTKVPILPGFTVVSGPNGSGKSNILDALLFCLGLASSRGMRAERLPDLVNHKHSHNGKTSEAIVSVTFDLSDLGDLEETVATSTEMIPVSGEELAKEIEAQRDRSAEGQGCGGAGEAGEAGEAEGAGEIDHDENRNKDIQDIQVIDNNGSLEWTVTRRLRVTKGGNYSSTFYINGQVSTATELHEKLEKLRIYPEGYNVVLQGDVTRIITMNSRERREIIDELAGVAAFDRKINQTRKTLEKVKDREEHCHIIEQELVANRDRLAADRVKAEKYRKLKEKIQLQKQQEIVLVWKSLTQKQEELQTEITKGEGKISQLTEALAKLDIEITEKTTNLAKLNSRVKALGEDEQLSVASDLATQKAKRQQLQQRQTELTTNLQQTNSAISQTEQNIQQFSQELTQLTATKTKLEQELIPNLSQQCARARETLNHSKESADAIAAASEAWVQEQANLTRNISSIQDILNPQRTERAQLTERLTQLESKFTEQSQLLATTEQELTEKQTDISNLASQVTTAEKQISNLAQQLTSLESERNLAKDTQTRLLKEQRDKQRELDKLEATKQAQQEVQGTYASQIILNANLPGVHGLVAQLGQVEPNYQLALETAAGGRLGCIVVENDGVGAQGIELLKRQRGGRATFFPLNKIHAPRLLDTTNLRYANGYIDLAVNLISCESRYQKIFAYVFNNTVVFDRLDRARTYIGKYRIVTLEGEILEASGAMTGGSKSNRSSLHFGRAATGESLEIKALRERLTEIARILAGNEGILSKTSAQVQQLQQELIATRQQYREKQFRWEQLQQEINRLTKQQQQLTTQISNYQQEKAKITSSIAILAASIPEQETQLQAYQQRLNELEESHDRSEWQQVQALIKSQENELKTHETKLREAENNLKDAENNYQRIQDKLAEAQQNLTILQQQIITNNQLITTNNQKITELTKKITQGEQKLQQLTEQLGETKKERDRVESQLKELQTQQQQKSWQREKIQTNQQENKITLASLEQQIAEQVQELPNPLPEIPELINTDGEAGTEPITFANIQADLEQIHKQIRNGEKRLEAMEPVNMLALEEYEKTEARLQELSDKLNTIEAERTELLLRVEKFTTLRYRAFKEAFDTVNENFQIIFAELSDGDGHLQLDDEEDPFNGGLNLVAHPKGKPVQRLSSMSGGEKSLTALSFIFSLQKYRPSPFYAFDEVDMFLDGANVEKLSKMVKKQAEEAQFIVVSLRRPMIEASERTIGVTQARGAHTQVVGIKMR